MENKHTDLIKLINKVDRLDLNFTYLTKMLHEKTGYEPFDYYRDLGSLLGYISIILILFLYFITV